MATIQIADKPTLDEIKVQVAPNNTEDAQGTIHQKLTAIWNYIKSILGRPEDGGGTMTSGSITAKLNELLATWSVTRAGYVDRLANGTYGLDKIKTDTGNILNKLNSGISVSEKRANDYCKQVSNTTTMISSTTTISTSKNSSNPQLLGTFTLPTNCLTVNISAVVRTAVIQSSSAYKITIKINVVKSDGSEAVATSQTHNGTTAGTINYTVGYNLCSQYTGIKIYAYMGGSCEGYVDSVKLTAKTPQRVTTGSFAKGDFWQLYNAKDSHTVPTNLPRLDRCDFLSYNASSSSYDYMKTMTIDGITYVSALPIYTYTIVKY